MRQSKFTEFLTAINSAESARALERLERRLTVEQHCAPADEGERMQYLLEMLQRRQQTLQAREG